MHSLAVDNRKLCIQTSQMINEIISFVVIKVDANANDKLESFVNLSGGGNRKCGKAEIGCS